MTRVFGKIGITLGLLYLAGLAASFLAFPAFFFRPPRQQAGIPPEQRAALVALAPEFLACAEPVSVTTPDGASLGVTIHGGGHRGTVVLIPDRACSGQSVADQALVAWLAGCTVAVLDPRGQGRSADTLETLGLRETRDVIAVIDDLAQRGRLQGRVALWGVRSGSRAAARAAAGDPRVAALLLEAPFASLREQITDLFSLGGLLPTPLVALPVELALRGSASFMAGFDPEASDVVVTARDLELPTLLIPSEAAPPDQIEQIRQALPENCRATSPPHAGGPGATGHAAFRQAVDEFLEAHI